MSVESGDLKKIHEQLSAIESAAEQKSDLDKRIKNIYFGIDHNGDVTVVKKWSLRGVKDRVCSVLRKIGINYGDNLDSGEVAKKLLDIVSKSKGNESEDIKKAIACFAKKVFESYHKKLPKKAGRLENKEKFLTKRYVLTERMNELSKLFKQAKQAGEAELNPPEKDESIADLLTTLKNDFVSPVDETKFRNALSDGNKDELKRLFRDSSFVNYAFKTGNTPLNIAVEVGDKEMVKFLIDDCSADINLPDKRGITPLEVSINKKDLDLVKLLTRKGADPERVEINGFTPIKYAIAKSTDDKSKKISNFLINYQNSEELSPLVNAVINGKLGDVNYLINNSADVNITYKGYTPLDLAVRAENPDWTIIDKLIQSGAKTGPKLQQDEIDKLKAISGGSMVFDKLNEIVSQDRLTEELAKAISTGNNDEIQSVIKKGADINRKTIDGKPLLILAIEEKNAGLNVVRILLENEANINCSDRTGCSPIHAACKSGNKEIVDLFLNHKAFVNHEDSHGNTTLHYACIGGNLEVVKSIYDRIPGRLDYQNEYGDTPLHSACYNKNVEIINYLEEQGARQDILNHKEMMPKECARWFK